MPAGSVTENFLLIAQGTTRYAPFLAGWQEFKDNLREIIEYQPGWTEVTAGTRKGEMRGWCSIDRKADASAAYDYYASKKGTLVHLFETPRENREYRLLKCNCSPHFPDVCERGHSPQQSGLDNTGVNKFVSRKSGIVATPQYTVPPAPVYSYAMYTQTAVYPPTPTYSYSAAPVQIVSQQRPVYSTPSSGLPVNVSNGLYMTEARGIFINNLSYTTTSNDLLLLLCQVAQPVEVKLHNDPKTNTFKGIATAQFATPELAMTVVQELNHKEHKGMLINVRLDKERTKVGQVSSPLIVNGSNYARVSTRRSYVSN